MKKDRNLIVEDLLVKPSAVSPMLFVGLGGCGCRMVARISRHLRQLPDYEERYRSLVKIALVDTNVNDLESYREIADETFLVSDFEKEQYANLAAGKDFLEADEFFTQWVPANYRFRTGDTSGAGQIRIESRLGVYYQMKHKEFVPRFRRLLEDLKSHEHGHRRLDTSEIRIVICYSVAGGTGSGCHLPIAYMLREQAEDLGKPRVLGVAVMPAVFEDKTGINKDGTFANGYAALKETEHLMKLGAPESRFFPKDGLDFHFNPSDQSDPKVRVRPFEFLYIIDKPESFSVPNPVDAAADGLSLQFFSPLFAEQMSDYDNYTQHQRFLVPQDFGKKGIIGFTSFYGSFGAAVLRVPSEGLLNYCSQAAALGLMRASFLGEIPGDPVFQTLRAHRERFHEVKLKDDDDGKAIPEIDFRRKESTVRDRLRDRLFMKRIRLLAAAEANGQKEARFTALCRHGHRLGERPTLEGGFEFRQDRIKEERPQLTDDGMRYSIGGVRLPLLAGKRPGTEAEILKKARSAIEDERPWNSAEGGITVAELKTRAETWVQDYRMAGQRIVRHGFSEGTFAYPGMDELVDLGFMKTRAGEVELAAKRYAVLRLLEEVQWGLSRPERTEISIAGKSDSDRIKEKDAPAIYKQFDSLAQERAFEDVKISFLERLGELKARLDEFARVQRTLEQGFADLERQQNRRLERLRERGDVSVDESKPTYVLSAEALQAEDGRRLWDFYYEDKVSGQPDLSLSSRRIQTVLSDTVTDLSLLASETSTSVRLEQLFDSLREHTREVLKSRILGDPYSS
ncbi:MAG: tubulin-like doman-containing protein, partial [Acidobacteriota bacterium]